MQKGTVDATVSACVLPLNPQKTHQRHHCSLLLKEPQTLMQSFAICSLADISSSLLGHSETQLLRWIW